MPLYRVVERRCYDSEYVIDADDEEAAQNLNGTIVEEQDGDSFAESLISSEQVE